MKLGGTQSYGIKVLHQNFQNLAEENDKLRGVVDKLAFSNGPTRAISSITGSKKRKIWRPGRYGNLICCLPAANLMVQANDRRKCISL